MKYLFRIIKALSQVSLGFGQSKVPLRFEALKVEVHRAADRSRPRKLLHVFHSRHICITQDSQVPRNPGMLSSEAEESFNPT